jgi:hypothetical protein
MVYLRVAESGTPSDWRCMPKILRAGRSACSQILGHELRSGQRSWSPT